MKRAFKLSTTLLIGLFAAACQDRQDPLTPPDDGARPSYAINQIGGVFFLAPIGNATSSAGFLGTLSPTVTVCQWNGTTCAAGTTLATFSKTAGTGGATIGVATDNSYQVNWKTDETLTPVVSGATYQIVVQLGGSLLGTADIALF